MHNFYKATPEESGIPSHALLSFLQRLETYHIPMHSILMARGTEEAKLCLEAYYKPFDANRLHRMFSITKSLTSLAIGHLASEGKLALSDKIITYFPEKLPQKVHPYLADMTIHHMLSMQSCHHQSTYKLDMDSDWVASFFTTPQNHPPGTLFHYDTSASHTLAALVERLSGMPLLDYLRIHVLDAIGFSQDSYILKDPFGVSMGGSGLMAKPSDLLLLGKFLIQGGKAHGKQLIAKEYMQAALSLQVDTRLQGSFLDTQQGYGYQFWHSRHGGFACYGMGGQLLLCFPEHDLVVVTTADTQTIQGGDGIIYQALYEEVFPHLSNTPLSKNSNAVHALHQYIERLQLLPASSTPALYQTSVHYQAVLKPNPSGFTKLMVHCKKDTGTITFASDTNSYSLTFGIGTMIESEFPIYQQPCATSGCWITPEKLYIHSHLIGEYLGSVQLYVACSGKTLTVQMKKTEESLPLHFHGYLQGELQAHASEDPTC